MTWTPELWRRIEQVFESASGLQGELRAAYLAAECGADEELRRAVDGMLAADGADDAVVDATALPEPRADAHAGELLGPWRIEEKIAEGGMGTVYRGRREDGAFSRPVAVKVLHLGLASAHARERFLREPKLLGRLEHPHIVRLLDGGTTSDGLPFVVMELVNGEPIDRYCDTRRLPLVKRLELFAQVCHAVDHAHRALVVHCDLKPSNVLVNEEGEPRLVDFGVAALLSGAEEATADSPSTAILAAYTPAYSSPERLRGEAPTIAGDIWSLGVLLHELLTGRRPYDADSIRALAASGATAVRPRRPSEEFDPRVSDRSERAAARAASPRALARQLRDDLDAIVGRALRPSAVARYANARELALDVERRLRGRPVIAERRGTAYRVRKFVRRHRVATALAVALAISSIAGTIFALRMAHVAEAGRLAAEIARADAEADARHAGIEADSGARLLESLTNVFLNEEFFSDAQSRERARERIELEVALVRKQHGDDFHLRANLLDALGRAAGRIALPELAESLVREALDIRTEHFGADHMERALSLTSLGTLLYARGDAVAARDTFEETLRIHRLHPGAVHEDVARVLNDLGAACTASGAFRRATLLHTEALELRRARDPESLMVAESQNNLASALLRIGELEDANAALEEAIRIRRAILGDTALLTLQCIGNRGVLALRRGDAAAARRDLVAAIAGLRSTRSAGTEGLASLLPKLAQTELMLGDGDAAAAAIDEAESLLAQLYPHAHSRVADLAEQRARLAEYRHDPPGAVGHWEHALALRREVLPADHPSIEVTLHNLACARADAGDVGAALADFEQSLKTRQGDSPQHAITRLAMGRILLKQGRASEAEVALLAALAGLVPDDPNLRTEIERTLGEAYRANGREADARSIEARRR